LILISKPLRERRLRALALLAAVALGAAGCGRRGDLEPPPDASAVQKPGAEAGGFQVHKDNPPIKPPKTPFVLDPVL
jgi:predicted small lipoprotein YifL